LLNETINFGKYKEKLVKDLFLDASYVNWIMLNFKEGDFKQALKKLINYFNNDYVEWDYLHFRPKTKVPTSSIESTTPSNWYKHPDYGWVELIDGDDVNFVDDCVGCYD
jgi:hypothetical protein